MNDYLKIIKKMSVLSAFICIITLSPKFLYSKSDIKKINSMKISIIVGSVRSTPTGKQIAKNLQQLLKNRTDITTEIIFISDFQLPFYIDELSPASRTAEIIDPVLKKWSDYINQAESFIIICPEYNAGYTAPLKNALDSIYKEWNHKPVGIVGYSGGPSGGTAMIAQLQQVLARLEMITVATSVKIPSSWKAFDAQGNFVDVDTIEKDLQTMVDEMVKIRNK